MHMNLETRKRVGLARESGVSLEGHDENGGAGWEKVCR